MKTTAKTLSRRVLGAILALCMLAGLLPMTVFAAAPAPLYADWDGTKAEWVQPAGDYQRIRYHIFLVSRTGANAGRVVFEDTTERTSYDLGSAISRNGAGDYFFIVQSETGSLSITADPDDPNAQFTWNGDLSTEVQSRTLYSTSVSLEAPSNLQWDGNVVVWESVAGVELYDFRLYRNKEELLQYRATLSPPDTSGGKDLAWNGATNPFGGIMQNYGGDYYFKVRSLQESGYTGDWVQSPVRSITLTKVNGINIENASLDVTVGQAPQFNAKVAESDLSYYHIIEGWEGNDGKMITSDNAMNDRIANKILLFEDGVTYEYFIIVTAYTGYMVSDASPVKLNGKTLDYSIPDKAADGDEIAGLPIGGGFHQAQLFDLYSATAGADGPAFVEIQNAAKSASSVSVTAKWDAGEATPIVCAAVYDASGRMVSMEKIENAQSTGTQAITLPLSGSLSGEQLTVKVFLWKDFSSLQPLAPFDEQTV
ncbi:hypothetical protein [Ructibacterium gallinarum]|uniref:Fibronectin type-III domain-containing protein n=1 Tax=Ructibacterium gallinarum TaxID=2779355 RepID=A0A9D5R805_9FIRM|nr:hypothetical protein [Ructibacterium gallinarum]MBE5039851.1 hypothetical protein [Ructibacterium gallinarum]